MSSRSKKLCDSEIKEFLTRSEFSDDSECDDYEDDVLKHNSECERIMTSVRVMKPVLTTHLFQARLAMLVLKV